MGLLLPCSPKFLQGFYTGVFVGFFCFLFLFFSHQKTVNILLRAGMCVKYLCLFLCDFPAVFTYFPFTHWENCTSARLKTNVVPVEGLCWCSNLPCQKVVLKYKYVCVSKSVHIKLGNSLQIAQKIGL